MKSLDGNIRVNSSQSLQETEQLSCLFSHLIYNDMLILKSPCLCAALGLTVRMSDGSPALHRVLYRASRRGVIRCK